MLRRNWYVYYLGTTLPLGQNQHKICKNVGFAMLLLVLVDSCLHVGMTSSVFKQLQ